MTSGSLDPPRASFKPGFSHSQVIKNARNARIASTPSTIDRLRKLSCSIDRICKVESVPGVSIGLLDHGETLWTENIGFRDKSKTAHPDANTQYGIGHITMSMVAAGVGKLVEDGKLQWTSLLKEVIPEIDHTGVDWTQTATIADILAHRCGLDGEIATLLTDGGNCDIQPSLEVLLKTVGRIPQPLPHRESWLMCPWGYTIAAHIIEHISRQPLHEYLQNQLFRPLGMTSTTLRPSFEGNNNVAEPHASLSDGEACPLAFQPNFANTLFEGSRGAYSTVSDLLVWAKETLAASQNTEASANTALKQIPHIISNHIAMRNPSLMERSYGFGWARAQLPGVVGLLGGNSELWEMSEQPVFGAGNQSRLMIYHQGGGPGYSSFLALFPETQSAVVVLMNTTALSDAADWIARLLIEGLFDFAKPTDYVKLAEIGKKRTLDRFATLHDRLTEERIQGAPPLPLECYVGKYNNADYKYMLEVTLSPESGSDLMISFQGRDSHRYPLRHYYDHVFEWSMNFDELRKSGRYDITDPSYYKIRFETYPDNRASRIIWNIHEASVPGGLTFEWKDERLAEAWRAVRADIVAARDLQ
ncbi:Peptidase S12, Pab87-related, C-terminal [Penicillium expansum]|uniref:Peptidase S12, Pab87-related, C-terminal n=1 Tax=Penicillium expansum TaxID=27334 RepID=A0A0A2KHN3_PENEN|nr:Peptidase S12, Pab87-related, C-terminal [Penicillium expansum]KGO42599.1 Peptidase S12, Pab87-related, C-terminal [Penicillium expansum]KGO50352.1 Peptidase S12, Pab87-related, C-terminal [Penicillium expansum]KGO67312.1 Peptidase S12, Pab87-related, C-terminal [Penicillium expansum]